MALDRQHLRQISRNAVAILGAVAAAIGPIVPANALRFVYFMKLSHNQQVRQIITLYRDGAGGAVVMDRLQVPGTGTGGPGVAAEFGKPYLISGMDIEVPVYVLLEGERMGGLIPAGVGHVLASYYDETG